MTSAGQGKTLESARPQYAAGLTARTEQKRLNDAREEDRLLRRSDRLFARKERP